MAKEVWECLGITETELDLLNLAVWEFEKPDRERVARINAKWEQKTNGGKIAAMAFVNRMAELREAREKWNQH